MWNAFSKPTCGPDSPPGEWCAGDGSCGTDNPDNQCFFSDAVYTRVACALTPPSPPPPRPPRPPASPDESAMMPAPPPPSSLVLSQEVGDNDRSYGALSLPWLIVIIVWAVLIPCIILILLLYMRRAEWLCFKPKPAPAPIADLGYGGTLVIEEGA